MAVFTGVAGVAFRMDNIGMDGLNSWFYISTGGGVLTYTLRTRNTPAEQDLYEISTVSPVFAPQGNPGDVIELGDLTVNLTFSQFINGAPVVAGILTGEVWQSAQYTVGNGPSYDFRVGADHASSMTWFLGDDTVTLADEDDYFEDYGGNLHATLGGGNDYANLGDQSQYDNFEKFVDAGSGNDTIDCLYGYGTILGGLGDDKINGSKGAWLFDGGAGRDMIQAYGQSRIVDGLGSGNDTYAGGFDAQLYDVVASYTAGKVGILVDLVAGQISGGGHGVDTVSRIRSVEATGGNDTMIGIETTDNGTTFYGVRFWGNRGADQMMGATGLDSLYGGADNDVLTGWDGNDYLEGGTGADLLDGGIGADRMKGGSGADIFIFTSAADSTLATAGRDRILDFQAGIDDIDLSAFGTLTFMGAAAFTGTGQVRAVVSGGVTSVFVNLSGTIAPEMRIDLSGLYALTAGDFI